MDVTGYTTLGRQSGLIQEMNVIANNIANISTNGFRREGLIFSEYVQRLGPDESSLSMAHAHARAFERAQGPLTETGARFDFAIEGDGFFLLQTPDGNALTRSGSFTPNQNGELAAADGALLLDAGGAPIFVPLDARSVGLSADGTLSADGLPLNQVGLYLPEDPTTLSRREGTRFTTEGGLLPADDAVVLQGFLEGSNVDAVSEIARMIEVQRSYELGQSFLEQEDERLKSMMELMSR